jgi:hypothetical protein
MKRYLCISIAAIILSACGPEKIVKNGKSDYPIVITDTESIGLVRAGEMLHSYIGKMSGAKLIISTGEKEFPKKSIIIKEDASLDPDGYRIETLESNVIIAGGSHKGAVYGVVRLLEDWGCRKYSPDFEIIPDLKTIPFPEGGVMDQPANSFRIINGRFGFDEDYQDWQAIDQVGDKFANGYYVHTFNRLVPWEEYFDNHPEYYSYMGGKRIKDQLCLTNPNVFKIAINKLREEMEKQPEKDLWSVSQNDNFSYCQCENCQKIIDEEGAASGPVIRFVNAIADEFPDKTISTLAYQYSRQAPEVTKPRDNVQIMLCTIELNRSQPIAEDPRSASFLKDIEDWGNIASHIYLWDYTVNFSHHITPFPNLHVLQPNIQLFTNNNVHEHFQQSNTDIGHEFSELKSYLISHFLWNPSANRDSLLMDFTDGYYGEAAILIRDYIKGLEDDILETKEWLDIYGHPTAHENTFLAEDKVNGYLDLFEEAREVVEDDSARLIHVREANLPVQYAAMEIGKNHMFESRGWYKVEADNYVIRQDMVDMLEDFITTCRMIGVNTVNESGLRPEDYYSATKRFINVQVEGNLAFRKPVTAKPMPSVKYSKGDISYLTNGVQGASDYKVHWLGWEAEDFEIVLDLKETTQADSILIGSLYDPKSWIFHPASVTCFISEDGDNYAKIGTILVEGDQKTEPVTRSFSFRPGKDFRYIKFKVKGTIANPRWHPSAGGKSWVFIDEIVVK